ncbi:DUF4177 domain-containing protein [uncultured Roseobacter sp.]|uniref:DUF4177 domain-containing protein n=1 Tax=uncultured Roseobacter sp. TaxID=114847 RepID=UPI00260CFE7F|nr:DUF4177 domain-containing protein [uncultured Roseobacter sp.]
MPHYEYRVVPAPLRRSKTRAGIDTSSARLANALQTLMNDMGMRGWEYQRAEAIPQGDGGSAPVEVMLVFRRPVPARSPLVLQAAERLPAPPARKGPVPVPLPQDDKVPEVVARARTVAPAPVYTKPAGPDDDASGSEGATRMLQDNGVEDFSEVSGLTSSLLQLAAARKASGSNT